MAILEELVVEQGDLQH